MKDILRQPLLAALLCLGAALAQAQQEEPQVERSATPTDEQPERRVHHDEIFHFGEDAVLPAGESANAVVAVAGDAQAAGKVANSVMAIFGDANVTGPVGDSVAALFGNVYIDNTVSDVVAVFGDLRLGPHAEVRGDVATIGGTITREPGAVVRGKSEIVLGKDLVQFQWLHTWVEHCLLYGRLLAFEPDLGWAWMIAGAFLLLYLMIALLFGDSVRRCVETVETHPGQSAIASLLTVILTPVMFLLLLISLIGIAVIPFVAMALFCVGLFGKAVMLAAVGRRVTAFTGIAASGHIAFAVLIGGAIVLGLYTVPVLGIIAYKLLGIVGMGVVVYTILLAIRQRNANRAEPTRAEAVVAAAAAATVAEPAQTVPEPAAATPTPSEAPPAPAATTAAPVLAGFWIRMGALLLDVILVGVIAQFLEPLDNITLLLLAGYGALMWKLKGTTIGGIVCGLKVVRRDGAEIGWDTAIVRALGCFLSLVVALLGFLWIAFDDERQAWHDKIAGTLVVRTPRTQPLV